MTRSNTRVIELADVYVALTLGASPSTPAGASYTEIVARFANRMFGRFTRGNQPVGARVIRHFASFYVGAENVLDVQMGWARDQLERGDLEVPPDTRATFSPSNIRVSVT